VAPVHEAAVRAAAALAAVALALGGCGDDDSGGSAAEGKLTISAAASLTDAFPAYGATIPGEERYSFAGSDELAAQIRQGAAPDVFASANTIYPDELFDEGLVEEPVVFTRNQLVVAVPADSEIQSVDELAEPGLDLVIGAKGVPVGDYTREVIGRLPSGEADAILANVRSEESDVKGVMGKLTQGAADAGFVYDSDVAAAGESLRPIELPAKLQPEVSYAIAVVADAANPDGARAFVDGLLEPEGQRILEDNGFLPAAG
jgi:molybdate transport system substrate-binding protein